MKKQALILILAALLLSLTSCGEEASSQVMVANVGEICGIGSVGMVDRFAGVVVTEQETKIERNENIEVKEILVKVGDSVKEGDTLFTYDNTQLEYSIEQAKLDLEQRKLRLEALKSDKEKLEKEKEKAKEDQQLSYSLEIREIEAEILESEYNIKLKEQELIKSEAALTETSVEAPVSGRIQAINKDGGYDTNGNPLPFMSIVTDTSFRVQGYVNETNMQSLYPGMEVLIRSRVDQSFWRGNVESIDTSNGKNGSDNYYYYDGDKTSSSTKYPFYILLQDSEGLMLGQHVYIEPDYGQEEPVEETLMLPFYYIKDAETAPYVYAMNAEKKLEKRSLVLGEYSEWMGVWEIVSGLNKDDHIAYPAENLKEGMNCVVTSLNDIEIPWEEIYPDDGGEDYYNEDDFYKDDEGVITIPAFMDPNEEKAYERDKENGTFAPTASPVFAY